MKNPKHQSPRLSPIETKRKLPPVTQTATSEKQTVVVNPPAKPHQRGGSKLDRMIGLLRGKNGASIDALAKATGWQKHSVRGAIAGAIKKRLGLKVVVETHAGKRIYRVAR